MDMRCFSFAHTDVHDATSSRLLPSLTLPPSPFSLTPQVTIPELKEAVQKVVRERNQIASQVEDYKQITEAAKRERVLAIDEKDKLLHRCRRERKGGKKGGGWREEGAWEGGRVGGMDRLICP